MILETRTYKSEFRNIGEDSPRIEGYSTLFNTESRTFSSSIGEFVEIVTKNAFDGADTSNVVAMWEHKSEFPLAATRNNTLDLEIDERGVKYAFSPSETTYSKDLLINIRSGLVNQSSFGFTFAPGDEGQEWERRDDGKLVRYIKRIQDWFDVSPVTHAAFPDTSVAERSYKHFIEERKAKTYYGFGRFAMRLNEIQLENLNTPKIDLL